MNPLTTKEAAERLGVTTVRVCAMITAGRQPAQRFGRAYIIKEGDLKLVQDHKPGRPVQKAVKKVNGRP
jgi:excisionase family DNA binding protein